MSTLYELPSLSLHSLFFLTVCSYAADGCRVNQEVCTVHGHNSGAFGVPLIPTNKNTEVSDRGLDRLEAEVSWGEVEFLVEAWIVRDVHLAVFAGDGSVFFHYDCGVMIDSRCASFEE